MFPMMAFSAGLVTKGGTENSNSRHKTVIIVILRLTDLLIVAETFVVVTIS